MPLLQFGPYQFKMRGLAPHLIVRYDEWRFGETERLSGEHALQRLGRGPGEITLEATLFPRHFDGHSETHVDALRALGNSGRPQPLIRGDMKMLGFYVLTSLEEEGAYMDQRGRPGRDGLLIGLRRYGSGGVISSGIRLIRGLI